MVRLASGQSTRDLTAGAPAGGSCLPDLNALRVRRREGPGRVAIRWPGQFAWPAREPSWTSL
jgi:hypothetical protein